MLDKMTRIAVQLFFFFALILPGEMEHPMF